jgi:NhaA family Na+:H+ antiporter
MSETNVPLTPPGAFRPAHRIFQSLSKPIERFLQIEAASGVLLLLRRAGRARLGQLPLMPHSYERLWHTELTFGVGPWVSSPFISGSTTA